MSSHTGARLQANTIVSRDRDVHSGDLVFAGTRVPVETLVDYLKGGASVDEFLEGFPSVERWQVEGLLDLVADAVDGLRACDPRPPR